MWTMAEWPYVLELPAFMDNTDLLCRLHEYATCVGLTLGERLGSGVQGIVFSAKSQAEEGRVAIKVHERETAYLRERDAYLRLRELGITEILGCAVPELLEYDDKLLILEMTVVSRPFVLDFGGAHLDRPVDFSEEVMAEWQAAKKEQFGARWAEVQAILRVLETYGIFVEDVNPNNISLVD
jgi:hypothetical protein